jgi:hypothetical protein
MAVYLEKKLGKKLNWRKGLPRVMMKKTSTALTAEMAEKTAVRASRRCLKLDSGRQVGRVLTAPVWDRDY